MDFNFWGLTAHSFTTPMSSEADEDPRKYLTCPFCYVDTELSLFCNHLQDEHCFSVNNAVCPVCALNFGKDVVEHFEVHHTSLIKTRRSQKSGFWSSYAGRSSLGGSSTKSSSENVHGSALDPLLSPFLFSISYSATKDDQSNGSCSIDDVSTFPKAESCIPSMPSQCEGVEVSEEQSQRAAFCQHLILSTIF